MKARGAFNLGRALGLPRTLEMLPLTVVWAVAAFVLFEGRTRAIRLAQGMAAAVALTMGLWPALARGNFLTKREPGLCQTVSANETWAYLSDYALQAEPSRDAITHRVKAPGITLPGDDAMPTSVGSESVAITFEGELEPTAAGWHVVKMEAIGEAALYIDGLRRLGIEATEPIPQAEMAQVYLSKDPHELVVRYMSHQPVRRLEVLIAFRAQPLVPLGEGLSTRTCEP